MSALLLLLTFTGFGAENDLHHLVTRDGTQLEYRLAAPSEKKDRYPVLLALPPGPQTLGTVDWGMKNLYREQALKRGWVVVSPVAPASRLFFQGSERYLPELLSHLARDYPPEGGKFHLAGVSNGGLAAFRVLTLYPELFLSVAVLPGWPSPNDIPKLDKVKDIPLRMWTGESETPARLALMRRALRMLESLGAPVELLILPGEGHNLRSLRGGEALYLFLETHRKRP